MELLIVIIIIGLITAFAIPNFHRMRGQAIERNAADSLETMWDALQQYKAHHDGAYPDPDVEGNGDGVLDINEINQILHLNIIPYAVTYGCDTMFTFNCYAISTHGWGLHKDAASPKSHCMVSSECESCTVPGTPCPTCSYSGSTGCSYY